jgi:hypothetical protein
MILYTLSMESPKIHLTKISNRHKIGDQKQMVRFMESYQIIEVSALLILFLLHEVIFSRKSIFRSCNQLGLLLLSLQLLKIILKTFEKIVVD